MKKGYILTFSVITLVLAYLIPAIFARINIEEGSTEDIVGASGFSWVQVVILMAVIVLLYLVNLHTVATDEELKVKFFPVRTKYRVFPWASISRIEVREFHPRRQFGGWGMRLGYDGTHAMTLQGKYGIFIETKDGHSYLIGTANPDKWREIIARKGPGGTGSAPLPENPPENPMNPIKPIPPVTPV